MSKRARGGEPAAKEGETAKGKKAKSQSKRKRRSRRGDTKKARERAAGLIDPNVSVVVKDELRIQILSVAIQRLYAPSEFARDADIALNVASYHFKVLKDHGILELVETVRVKGTLKHMYRATKSGFISDADWGEVANALRPGVAGAILQDFNGRVTQAIETGTLFSRVDACIYWAPRDLDEIAYLEQVKMIAWCIEESKRLEVETVERRCNGESEGSFHTTFAIAGFPSPTHEEVKAKEREKKKGKRKRKAPQGKVKAKGKKASNAKDASKRKATKSKETTKAKGKGGKA